MPTRLSVDPRTQDALLAEAIHGETPAELWDLWAAAPWSPCVGLSEKATIVTWRPPAFSDLDAQRLRVGRVSQARTPPHTQYCEFTGHMALGRDESWSSLNALAFALGLTEWSWLAEHTLALPFPATSLHPLALPTTNPTHAVVIRVPPSSPASPSPAPSSRCWPACTDPDQQVCGRMDPRWIGIRAKGPLNATPDPMPEASPEPRGPSDIKTQELWGVELVAQVYKTVEAPDDHTPLTSRAWEHILTLPEWAPHVCADATPL